MLQTELETDFECTFQFRFIFECLETDFESTLNDEKSFGRLHKLE